MRIGELARKTGVEADNIRYYEKEGLLPAPSRQINGYRAYGQAHLDRLAFIRHCRSLDMTLAEIRVLLRFRDAPEANCGEVNALLDEHIGHVVVRIEELQQLEKELRKLRRQCRQAKAAQACGILAGIAKESGKANTPGKLRRHVAGAH